MFNKKFEFSEFFFRKLYETLGSRGEFSQIS